MKQDTSQAGLNGFLEKATVKPQSKTTPKLQLPKPKFCEECVYFERNNVHRSSTLLSNKCKLSGTYGITPKTKACKSALPRKERP